MSETAASTSQDTPPVANSSDDKTPPLDVQPQNISPDKQQNSSKPRQRRGSYRARSASNVSVSTQINTEQRQKNVHVLVDHLFNDIADMVQGEMQIGFNDLKLLESMNAAVTKKYDTMNQRTGAIREHMTKMKQQYEQFKPHFEQVNEMERAVNELETVVKYLDQYTKSLETQLKPYL